MDRMGALKQMTAGMVGVAILHRDDIAWVMANLAKCVTHTLLTIRQDEIDRVSQLVEAALQT